MLHARIAGDDLAFDEAHAVRSRNGKAFHRRPEAEAFRINLQLLRDELALNQDQLAARLGISKRTLSNWENGYWLPPFKQRLHVVLSLRDAPPAYVLRIADALGVSVDPAVETFLQPFEDAVHGPPEPEDPPPAAPPAPPPPPPRPSPEALRAAVDAAVKDAADALDARPNDVREAVGRVLAACLGLGGTLEEASVAVAVRAGAKRASRSP